MFRLQSESEPTAVVPAFCAPTMKKVGRHVTLPEVVFVQQHCARTGPGSYLHCSAKKDFTFMFVPEEQMKKQTIESRDHSQAGLANQISRAQCACEQCCDQHSAHVHGAHAV